MGICLSLFLRDGQAHTLLMCATAISERGVPRSEHLLRHIYQSHRALMNDSINNLNSLLLLGVLFASGHPKLQTAWPPSTWFNIKDLSQPRVELRRLYDHKVIRVTCISTSFKQLLALKIVADNVLHCTGAT